MKSYLLSFIFVCLLSFSFVLDAQKKVQDEARLFIEKEGRKPSDYLISKFNKANVVLLAEDHAVKENLNFVKSLIPILYKNNITLGMEFGAYEDQNRLDSLITAPEYDEKVARQIMFNYNTKWAISEYMELYKAAWKLNKSLGNNERKFKILNVSYRYNWTNFSGARSPENMQIVFPKGNTEDFRYKIIEQEILDKNQKILVLTGTIHAFTFYQFPHYDYTSPGFVRFESRMLGNLLYSKYGDKITSIVLHQPFPNKLNHQPALVSPANGDVEKIISCLGNKQVGFDLKGTSAGKLIDSSYYSMGYRNFKLENLFDGYIFLSPIKNLHSCNLDYQFVVNENFKEAVINFPDPDWQPRPDNLEEYWNLVKEYTNITKRYMFVE